MSTTQSNHVQWKINNDENAKLMLLEIYENQNSVRFFFATTSWNCIIYELPYAAFMHTIFYDYQLILP